MSIAISGLVLWSVALLAQAPEAVSPVGPLETTAAPAHLIKDINATPDVHNRGSRILGLIRAGNLVYFTASTQTTGVEIWRTDGTPGGTFVPAELPGRYYNPWGAWEANGIAYFFAQTPGGVYELWRSDGTKAGTWRFKQFFGEIPVSLLTVHQEQTYFQVYNENTNADETWRTDGTASGTVFLTTALPFVPGGAVWSNGEIFFGRYEELWKTDGTDAGTVSVAGGCGGIPSDVVHDLVAMNGKVYYSADNCHGAFALYSSDGTPGGAQVVHDLAGDQAVVGGVLYFSAFDPPNGSALWMSDGSPEGTVKIKSVAGGLSSWSPTGFVGDGGVVWFTASDDEHGRELWKTDGTEQGTVLVKDVRPGETGSGIWEPGMTASGGALYFTANDGPHGVELWRSDGSAAGTILLKDIKPGADGQASRLPIVDLNGTVLFVAEDPNFGNEVWKTNGTGASTTLLKDINTVAATNNSMFFSQHVAMGSDLFFVADDGVHGDGVWKTDGTPGGTMLLKSIFFQREFPELWREFNENVVFTATDADHGTELWKSDGTAAGTVLVKDIFPGPGQASPIPVGVLGGALYFTASDGGARSLWKTDLTETGTVLVHEGVDRCADSLLVNGILYFAGDDGVHGCELWKIDPTTGAQMVVNIRPDDQTLYPPDAFVEWNGRLLFFVDDGVHGLEPWTSDGTEHNTYLVKDVYPGPVSSIYSGGLVASGGKIYFLADDGVHGAEIWVTDGSEDGTHLFLDVHPGPDPSYPTNPVDVGGKVMFSAFPDDFNRMLWSSDGTEEGTRVVAEGLADFTSATAIDGVLYYGADLPASEVGFALWHSDGTVKGTGQVQVIDRWSYALDVGGQDTLSGFTKIGHRIFFFADDGVSGLEPWVGWASVLANRPAQAIADLREEVNALNLPADASRVLLSSLRTAERALRGGDAYAIPWLESFVTQVNAETPQWIAPEAGAELIDFARGIVGLLEPKPEPPVE